MLLQRTILVVTLAMMTGCVGKAVNQAVIYQPVTGVIEMDVKLPSGESVTKVQFQVNDKVVGEDDGSSGTGTYSAEVDTSSLPVDTLAKLAAVGVHTDGTTVTLRENYILVETAPDASASTDATATDDASASTAATTAYRGGSPLPRVAVIPKVTKTSAKKTVIHL